MNKYERMQKFIFFLLLVTSFVTTSASADTLVSVQDYQGQGDTWAKRVCEKAFESIQSVRRENVSCFITPQGTVVDSRLKSLRSSGRYHTHLRIYRYSEISAEIVTTQWQRDDDTDFESTRFKITAEKPEELLQKIEKFSEGWAAYRTYRFLFKAQILESALPESKTVALNSKGELVDTLTYSPMTWREAYESFASESPRHRQYLRTAVQVTSLLGFGLFIYYRNIASMKEDHDYTSFWSTFGKKIRGEAAKEDDNNTGANVGHAFAGWLYFGAARNNGLNFIESTLVTVAASAAWEYVLEYKEIMSINDMIFTSWTGAVIGEVFYQMARALQNKSSSFPSRIMAGALNPMGVVNDKWNSWMGYESRRVRVGDLDTTQWSKFELSVVGGVQTFDKESKSKAFGLSFKGEVVNIPGYGKPGEDIRLVLETPIAEMELETTRGPFGTEDFKLVAQAVLAAYYNKNIQGEGSNLNGYEFLIGLSSGFEWDQKRAGLLSFEESQSPGKDFWARGHILGTTVRAVGYYHGLRFELEMKVHGDYVMVSSYALEQFEATRGNRDGLLSVMKKRGYYYGTGWSRQLRAQVGYKGWTAGVKYRDSRVQGSGFAHRYDDHKTTQFRQEDGVQEATLFIRKALGKSWAVELAYIEVKRDGSISPGFKRVTKEKRVQTRLSYIW